MEVPKKGWARLTYSLKESFNKALEDGASIYDNNISGKFTHPIFSTTSSRKATMYTGLTIAGATCALYPEQALGVIGFGVSYLGARMKEARNMRSMYSVSCGFFSAQYMTNLEDGFGGLISAGSGMIRGVLLTVTPDDEIKKRAAIATTFAATSAISVGVLSYTTDNLSNLILVPGFALAAGSDFMGDNKSHAARFLKLGAFSTVAAYDFGIAQNYGSGLASIMLLKQTINTAEKSGDFYRDITRNDRHSVRTYLKSLTRDIA